MSLLISVLSLLFFRSWCASRFFQWKMCAVAQKSLNNAAVEYHYTTLPISIVYHTYGTCFLKCIILAAILILPTSKINHYWHIYMTLVLVQSARLSLGFEAKDKKQKIYISTILSTVIYLSFLICKLAKNRIVNMQTMYSMFLFMYDH